MRLFCQHGGWWDEAKEGKLPESRQNKGLEEGERQNTNTWDK